MANVIRINGFTITGARSVSVVNGKVIIDGKDMTPDEKVINISIDGNVEKIEADACSKIAVTGNVGKINTLSGDVEVNGDVAGSVQTVSGDIECSGSVAGSASSISGDIKYRK